MKNLLTSISEIIYFYAVKFIALILSVLVLTLTALPCCTLEGSEGGAHNTAQVDKQGCSEQDDDCCTDCSPFYVCGTCIGFTVTTQQVITFAVRVKPVLHNTAYIRVKLPVIPITKWQPPKLPS